MINGKKTPLEQQRETEFESVKDKFSFVATAVLTKPQGTTSIERVYDDIEGFLHGLKLSVMQFAKHDNTDVQVVIRLIRKGEGL